MPKTVTRQSQWPDGKYVVEISDGTLDYTNPGALSKKYPGEFETFDDPREAVETAIKIAKRWQEDAPDREILIGHGGTGGMTMPFDGLPLNDETFNDLKEWAEEEYNELEKCCRCGDVLGKERFTSWIFQDDDMQFCSENCAELAGELIEEDDEEE